MDAQTILTLKLILSTLFQNELRTAGFEKKRPRHFLYGHRCLGNCFKSLLWLASSKEPKMKDMITARLEIKQL